QLALNGGPRLRNEPFCAWPVVGDEEVNAVAQVVRTGKWGHLFGKDGSKVEQFRNAFASYYRVDYAIPVTNGSVALEVALRNAGVGYGDEVITPPTTWVATNLAPVVVGADPVFVDVLPDTYCIDPGRIEEAITPRTKAIIPVHIGGYPCEMDRIMEIAGRHDLVVVEDVAQAHGTRIKGALAGTFGHFGCFSFEISKLMTAGEGGMVITKETSLGERVFGQCGEGGRQTDRMTRGRQNVGWNTRMTEMQAAILIAQLARLEEHRKKRIENAAYLAKRLSEIDGIAPLKQDPEQNYYSYLFKYDAACFKGVPKNTFMAALEAEGIPLFSSPSHQPPAYRSPFFYSPRRDYANVRCPVAEKAFEEEAVGFRASGMLLGKRRDMDDIADAILKIQEHVEELPTQRPSTAGG
ncbi:MAG: DegT/DnrJ/EryC1/StrS family aminotransferase, partial [Planctomycetota bacterium]